MTVNQKALIAKANEQFNDILNEGKPACFGVFKDLRANIDLRYITDVKQLTKEHIRSAMIDIAENIIEQLEERGDL
jgi:hypothetical protein